MSNYNLLNGRIVKVPSVFSLLTEANILSKPDKFPTYTDFSELF